mgnify:CR=1 FL=1
MNEPTIHPSMNIPTNDMQQYRSIKTVLAGEIVEVVPAGCYVRERNGDSVLRPFLPNMTARYQPVVGDFWIVYPDGYQSISPRTAFVEGYVSTQPSDGGPSMEADAQREPS